MIKPIAGARTCVAALVATFGVTNAAGGAVVGQAGWPVGTGGGSATPRGADLAGEKTDEQNGHWARSGSGSGASSILPH
jgi:hypothetical protein